MRHPAKAVLDDFGKWNPGIWKAVEKIRQRLPSGPRSLPIEQISQIAIPSQDNATLMALAHWEPTRGIYRFDENLYADLIASPGERVSVDALMQMPEPCIFVETPRLPVSCNGYEHAAVGAWVFVGRMTTDDARFLQLTFLSEVYDEGGGLLTYPMLTTRMLLPPRGLLSVRGALQDTVRQAIAAELATDDDHDSLEHLGQPIAAVLALVLYLCREPDVTQDGREARIPDRRAIKVRRLGVMRPRATVWEVGVRVGADIKAARARYEQQTDDQQNSGRTVRPHVRRGHLHTFYLGPRKAADGAKVPPSARVAQVRWIDNVTIHKGRGELPATIRQVWGEREMNHEQE